MLRRWVIDRSSHAFSQWIVRSAVGCNLPPLSGRFDLADWRSDAIRSKRYPIRRHPIVLSTIAGLRFWIYDKSYSKSYGQSRRSSPDAIVEYAGQDYSAGGVSLESVAWSRPVSENKMNHNVFRFQKTFGMLKSAEWSVTCLTRTLWLGCFELRGLETLSRARPWVLGILNGAEQAGTNLISYGRVCIMCN